MSVAELEMHPITSPLLVSPKSHSDATMPQIVPHPRTTDPQASDTVIVPEISAQTIAKVFVLEDCQSLVISSQPLLTNPRRLTVSFAEVDKVSGNRPAKSVTPRTPSVVGSLRRPNLTVFLTPPMLSAPEFSAAHPSLFIPHERSNSNTDLRNQQEHQENQHQYEHMFQSVAQPTEADSDNAASHSRSDTKINLSVPRRRSSQVYSFDLTPRPYIFPCSPSPHPYAQRALTPFTHNRANTVIVALTLDTIVSPPELGVQRFKSKSAKGFSSGARECGIGMEWRTRFSHHLRARSAYSAMYISGHDSMHGLKSP